MACGQKSRAIEIIRELVASRSRSAVFRVLVMCRSPTRGNVVGLRNPRAVQIFPSPRNLHFGNLRKDPFRVEFVCCLCDRQEQHPISLATPPYRDQLKVYQLERTTIADESDASYIAGRSGFWSFLSRRRALRGVSSYGSTATWSCSMLAGTLC